MTSKPGRFIDFGQGLPDPAVLKTVDSETGPGVRIPPPPPIKPASNQLETDSDPAPETPPTKHAVASGVANGSAPDRSMDPYWRGYADGTASYERDVIRSRQLGFWPPSKEQHERIAALEAERDAETQQVQDAREQLYSMTEQWNEMVAERDAALARLRRLQPTAPFVGPRCSICNWDNTGCPNAEADAGCRDRHDKLLVEATARVRELEAFTPFAGADIDPEHPIAKHRAKWMRGENPPWDGLDAATKEYGARLAALEAEGAELKSELRAALERKDG